MVVEKEKDLKDPNCYLTMACMKHLKEDFDNDLATDNLLNDDDIIDE